MSNVIDIATARKKKRESKIDVAVDVMIGAVFELRRGGLSTHDITRLLEAFVRVVRDHDFDRAA
jgi:hypothetical protein